MPAAEDLAEAVLRFLGDPRTPPLPTEYVVVLKDLAENTLIQESERDWIRDDG